MRPRLKDLLGRCVFDAGLNRRKLAGQATIVLFHRVDDRLAGNPISRTVAEFRAFCAFFKDHFEVISLSELIARQADRRDISRTLVITFDDGYLDNYTNAAPILREFGLPATFFIATGFIGTELVPYWDEQLPFRPAWMTWDNVKALAEMGFEIGAHTDTHVDLGRVGHAQARMEISTSKAKLEARLDQPVNLFAYPFGGREHITEGTRELVRDAGFSCCVSAHGGGVFAGDSRFALHRMPISPWYATPHQFGFELIRQSTGAA